jgi:hypothetical protein
MFMSLFFNFFILQVWQGLLKFSENYLKLDLQITPFFKNKHFELCCFVVYRVRNIVNRRESDVICHSVRRSRIPTSRYILFRPEGHLCSPQGLGLCSLIDYCICLWDLLGTNIWDHDDHSVLPWEFVNIWYNHHPKSYSMMLNISEWGFSISSMRTEYGSSQKQPVLTVHLPHTQHTLGGAIWRIHASPPANNPNANADWLAPDGASV